MNTPDRLKSFRIHFESILTGFNNFNFIDDPGKLSIWRTINIIFISVCAYLYLSVVNNSKIQLNFGVENGKKFEIG